MIPSVDVDPLERSQYSRSSAASVVVVSAGNGSASASTVSTSLVGDFECGGVCEGGGSG